MSLQVKKNDFFITVIIPFYKGNDYIEDAVNSIRISSFSCIIEHRLEIVIVNDSPWIDVSLLDRNNVRVIVNETNLGIHASRQVGLRYAKGNYILFLDQDDTICKDFFSSILTVFSREKDADYVVGNALFELLGNPSALYKSKYSFFILNRKFFYLRDGCQIVSPGQSLIKKEAIPTEWTRCVLDSNGADDYMLWLMMIVQRRSCVYLNKKVYNHHYTNQNLSNDVKKMKMSEQEVLDLLYHKKYLNKSEYDIAVNRINFQLQAKKERNPYKRMLLFSRNSINILAYVLAKLLRLR